MAVTPKPGQRVRGSTTGRPLMAAMDLLGRRWSLRILWELRGEALGARELLTRCEGLSSSVLYDRLNDLGTGLLVVQTEDAKYTLTPLGASVGEAIEPLDAWSKKWDRAVNRR
jgi:DNA-binding HxlR family transcriptional regulator